MNSPQDASPGSRLISQLLLDDPEMIDIVEEFVDELPARIAELREAHRDLDWELLRNCAHRLKGAGGSYGYPMLSTVAAAMEAAFMERRDDRFSDLLAQLADLAEAAKAGLSTDA